jgi:hypothetical protein
MKDLPMFNKLFVVLYSLLVLCSSFAATAEEPTYHTIQGSGGEYEVFGTKQEALNTKDRLTNETWVNNNRIKAYQNQRAKYNASDETTEWINGKYVSQHELWDYKIAAERAKIKAEEQKIIAPMGEEREKKYKAQKIADAKAKLIEDERLAKIAADKVIEAARVAKIAADKVIEDARLAKIAAAKKIEDARLAKIAAAKKIEDARLAKIAHAENVARAARIKEEIKKQQLEKKISSVLKIIAGINGPKDPNKITSITKDGQVRTLYCSSPCTPGSVKLHEIITGIPMGVDVGTLTKRIEANAAQGKRQDNTNENNAKAAEDIASQGNVSIDTLFEQAEADIATHDTSFARAQSIPLGQRIRNREAHTEYVRSQSENEAYCLYEGC